MLFKFKNSRTKAKAKLLTLGALLFSFGVATSAVATSAWYNLLDIAIVSNLNLTINMDDAILELHLLDDDGLPVERLEGNDGYTSEQLGITDETILTDVSGMYQSKWFDEPNFNPSKDFPTFRTRYKIGTNQKDTGIEQVENRNKTYVQNAFQLHATAETDVYLDSTSFIDYNEKANKETIKMNNWDEDRLRELNKVANAVRISILTEDGDYFIIKRGEVDEEDVYFGGILDLNKDGYYDNDGEKEYLYGEYSEDYDYAAKTLDGLDADPSEDDLQRAKNNHNTFKAYSQKGVRRVDIDDAYNHIQKENALLIDSMSFDINDPLKLTAQQICHVEAGETKRIVVSIYVEGWDPDMTDDIASASFDVNVAFTGLVK